MSNNTRDLCFFTAQYPYGESETFIESELPVLASQFDNIYIFPASVSKEKREVPNNVIIVDINLSDYSTSKALGSYPVSIAKAIFSEFIENRLLNLNTARNTISRLLRCAYKAQKVTEFIKDKNLSDAVYYSYWMEFDATMLAILKSEGIVNSFVSRAHRFDLYDDRYVTGKIPFRKFQINHLSSISLISEHGKKYIETHYPSSLKKTTLDYLGVKDFGIGNLDSRKDEECFIILSCSNVVPVKRVELLARALKLTTQKIHWIHFGDGELMGEVEQEAKNFPAHITYEFKGRVSNTIVLDFLKNEKIDIFINVSSSEGLPVSIMEAISFGLPVLATDVGGTSEIVNEETGKILPENVSAELLASEIDLFLTSERGSEKYRLDVRAFWKEHFNATDNYQRFATKLIEL
jgi:glycosyltransferase involved in cell wall biosynthesis